MNRLAKTLLESARFTLLESDQLVSLAKKDRTVLKNLISLFNAYRADDPHLQSKESNLSMRAILQKVSQFSQIPSEWYMLGNPNWEPNPLEWIAFFDRVGDQTFADFLGISSVDQIPAAEGIPTGQENDDFGNDELGQDPDLGDGDDLDGDLDDMLSNPEGDDEEDSVDGDSRGARHQERGIPRR